MMDIQELGKKAKMEIETAKDVKMLEALKVKYLGRKGGLVTKILKNLKNLSLEERRRTGPEANSLRKEIEDFLEKKLTEFASESAGKNIEGFDLTKPGRKIQTGHIHILSLVEKELRQIFTAMNFSVAQGPEIETEYYNFDALNVLPDHPARDMWDTFWLRQKEIQNPKSKVQKKERFLLRTHTSPVQIRYMESHQPPFQIIVPGRCFRYEASDLTHDINFHHLEGLMVGKEVNLANFKFVVEEVLKKFFGRGIDFRFRPSYFPFVEPGLEVDAKFKGKWLELMGAGMVHRNVFDAVHYNPNEIQGFAFGVGIERLAMVKYGIPNIRLFYSGDLRFIRQF